MKTQHLKMAMVSVALLGLLALVDLVGAQPALADDEAAARVSILSVLEHYRQASEARALAELASVHAEFSPRVVALQQRFFENAKDLKVAIDNVHVAVVGDEAVVSYTRTDDFADARTGLPVHMSARLTRTFCRENGGWKIARGKWKIAPAK